LKWDKPCSLQVCGVYALPFSFPLPDYKDPASPLVADGRVVPSMLAFFKKEI